MKNSVLKIFIFKIRPFQKLVSTAFFALTDDNNWRKKSESCQLHLRKISSAVRGMRGWKNTAGKIENTIDD